LFRVPVDRAPAIVVRPPELVTVQRAGDGAPWDLHPDGKQFLVAIPESDGSESTGVAQGTSRHVVVLNWFTELKELTKKAAP
jgi:hypothetical protein